MNKEVWGPKIWLIFHRLSFFSDRTDIVGAWTKMLKELHEIIPCALCKDHMGKYCMEHPLKRAISVGATSGDVKNAIINWAYQFHNHVNNSKGVAKFDRNNLQLFYGYGSRSEMIADVNRTVSELEKIWVTVPMHNFKMSLNYLMSLIAGGPFG
jgi:hypothetical protein